MRVKLLNAAAGPNFAGAKDAVIDVDDGWGRHLIAARAAVEMPPEPPPEQPRPFRVLGPDGKVRSFPSEAAWLAVADVFSQEGWKPAPEEVAPAVPEEKAPAAKAPPREEKPLFTSSPREAPLEPPADSPTAGRGKRRV